MPGKSTASEFTHSRFTKPLVSVSVLIGIGIGTDLCRTWIETVSPLTTHYREECAKRDAEIERLAANAKRFEKQAMACGDENARLRKLLFEAKKSCVADCRCGSDLADRIRAALEAK